AGFLTLLIAAPWLVPGYIFGTDWPGPRHFDFPNTISSSVLLQIAIAAFAKVLSSEIIGKLLIVGGLFVAALAAFRAVPVEGFVARAAAATIYICNPFVYGRLHYGQIFLLAGYAILPWIASE